MSDGKGFENSNCPIYRVHFSQVLKSNSPRPSELHETVDFTGFLPFLRYIIYSKTRSKSMAKSSKDIQFSELKDLI